MVDSGTAKREGRGRSRADRAREQSRLRGSLDKVLGRKGVQVRGCNLPYAPDQEAGKAAAAATVKNLVAPERRGGTHDGKDLQSFNRGDGEALGLKSPEEKRRRLSLIKERRGGYS